MKYLYVIVCCALTISMSFITTEIVPKRIEKAVFSTISIVIGGILTILFMYLILQFGKINNIYGETIACVVCSFLVLGLLEAIYSLTYK